MYAFSLRLDLRLLLVNGVDENNSDAVVIDALDLAAPVIEGKPWLDRRNLLRDQSDLRRIVPFPIKSYRPQLPDQVHTGCKCVDVRLVSDR